MTEKLVGYEEKVWYEDFLQWKPYEKNGGKEEEDIELFYPWNPEGSTEIQLVVPMMDRVKHPEKSEGVMEWMEDIVTEINQEETGDERKEGKRLLWLEAYRIPIPEEEVDRIECYGLNGDIFHDDAVYYIIDGTRYWMYPVFSVQAEEQLCENYEITEVIKSNKESHNSKHYNFSSSASMTFFKNFDKPIEGSNTLSFWGKYGILESWDW